ncbi:MAG: hypothetical protein M9894_13930 [Planctomycetes bacterium]|nr:hypothetical protein [Planctomycetota bacterium]
MRGTLLLLLLALALPARGQALPHVHPERDAEVPVSGWPTWVEDLTIGSPVSDFGSHAGVKATVTRDGQVPAKALLNQAHYGAFGSVAAQTDQVLVWAHDVASGRAVLAPPDDRRVTFHPWGWEETAVQGDLRAHGAVTTLATDAFLVLVRLENHGRTPRVLAPRLAVFADGDGVHESMHPLHLSWIVHRAASLDPLRNAAVFTHRRGTPLDPFAWDRMTLVRAIGADVPLTAVRSGVGAYAVGNRWARTVEAAPLVVPAGGARTFSFVVGCGEDRREAEASLARGRAAVGADAQAALARVRAGWDADLARLPRPHAASPDEERLYRIAYTGLRHNRFARRGAMTGDCATAAKVHFNTFFVWDVALHAWAEAEWDPAFAREALLTLFRAQRREGHLHYTVGPDLQPAVGLIAGTTQAPIHGWVIEKVLQHGADRAFLTEVYDRSARWLEFFAQRRDKDGDGLPGFGSALETGWDDTPRYPNLHPAPKLNLFGLEVHLGNLSGLLPVNDVNALDLACWLHAYHKAMARWADDLGRPADAAGWRQRAADLAAAIDARLWDPVTGSYRDGRVGSSGVVTPVRVDTPVVAWPLFLGVCRDLDRARSTIERHLLDPLRFMGDPDDPARPYVPMPSVAYTDPEYDHATDGYYWRGQVWLVPAYAAVEALFKYGWEQESRELRRRLVRSLLRAHGNGIYETYDALSDRIGFGSGSLTGPGEPAAFLIGGISCAPVAQLLLDRHERERFVTTRDAAFEGFVAEARVLETDALFYRARATAGIEVPRARLAARSGRLLPGGGTLELELDDPWGNLPAGPVTVELPTLAGYAVWGIDATGAATRLPAGPGPGVRFEATLTRGPGAGPFARYVLVSAGGTP